MIDSNFSLKNIGKIKLSLEPDQPFRQQTIQLLQSLEEDGVFSRIKSKGRKEEQKYLILIERLISAFLFDTVGTSPLISTIPDYANEIYYNHTANFVKAVIYSWDNRIIAPKLQQIFIQNKEDYKQELNILFKENCTIKEGSINEAYYFEIQNILSDQNPEVSLEHDLLLPFEIRIEPIATSLLDNEIIREFSPVGNNIFENNIEKLNQATLSQVINFINNGVVEKNMNIWRVKILETMYGELYKPFLIKLANVILHGKLEDGGV